MFTADTQILRLEPLRQHVKVDINHRRGKQRKHLRHDQAADNGDAQGHAQLGAYAATQCQRQTAQQGSHRGHDGPEPQEAGLENRVLRDLSFIALRLQRKIDHHNGVLLHNADQQNDADECNHAELDPRDQQRQQRAHTRGGKGRDDGDGVNIALVEHAQHNINSNERRQNQKRFIGQRRLECGCRALEAGVDARRHLDALLDTIHSFDCVPQGLSRR